MAILDVMSRIIRGLELMYRNDLPAPSSARKVRAISRCANFVLRLALLKQDEEKFSGAIQHQPVKASSSAAKTLFLKGFIG